MATYEGIVSGGPPRPPRAPKGAVTPTEPYHGGPRPRVFARLASDAQRKESTLVAPGWVRVAGWLMAVATFVLVMYVAGVVRPWE